MNPLTKQVLSYVEAQPEGTALTAKGLLHLSNRAAIDQTLSRLARRGEIMRRWEQMTPEEREKFREGMRGRCGGPRTPAPEPNA